METWAWLIAYVLGFALLQLYLYRYFIKGQSTTESSAGTTPNFDGGTAVDHGTATGATGDDLVACSQCGGHNENDAAFTYCKHCGGRLG